MPRPVATHKKCIGCGECCGHYLPMTSAEIAQIRLHTVVNMIEPRPDPVDCPWLKKNRTCAIYKVRPAICRAFHCQRSLEGRMPGKPGDYHIYNTLRLFIAINFSPRFTAALTGLSENGVLKSEGTGDGGLFKGVFVRYFVKLIQDEGLTQSESKRFASFLDNCANSLWTKGIISTDDPLFGPDWSRNDGNKDLGTHVSGAALLEAKALLERNKTGK